jgi:transposase InsO family protein
VSWVVLASGTSRAWPRHQTWWNAASQETTGPALGADITEHPTREGKVNCAVVLDVFSRRVVGWSIDSAATAALVTNARGIAISNRDPDDTVIQSDQGTQFTSWAFTRRALDSGLVPSMGSVRRCFDNAMIESFWSRMQTGEAGGREWSWPTPSSSIWRSSITASAVTRRLAC